MDLVYTWVDGADQEHRAKRRQYLPPESKDEDVGDHRYVEWDELRYSLRSVDRFAPWVERIFLVTDGQVPRWLRPQAPLYLVHHRDIFRRLEDLPTFNSNSIEANLSSIAGLSEKFVYLNDDVLFGAPTSPEDFFNAADGHRVYGGSLVVPPEGARFAQIESEQPAKELSLEEEQWLRRNLSAWIDGLGFTNSLLAKVYGQRARRSVAHVPFHFDRALLAATEQRWAAALAETSARRFRTGNDVVISFLYYQDVLERAQRGELKATMVSARALGVYETLRLSASLEMLERSLQRLERAPAKFLCVQPHPEVPHEVAAAYRRFMEKTFPEPSRFERPDASARSG